MAVKYIVVAVIASALTVFALQNSAPTDIHFLVWTLRATPLAGVILLSAALGIVLAGLPLAIDRWRLRARVRSLELRLASLEAQLTEQT